MFIDDLLVIDDAQAITVSSESQNVIDTLAAGDAMGEEMYAVFQIDTAFTSGTENATLQLAIQDSADDATYTTVVSKNVTLTDIDAANVVVWAVKLPVGMRRYIRAYYAASHTMTAGKIDCRLVKDIDKGINGLL